MASLTIGKGGTNVMVVINLYLIGLRSIIHDYKGFVLDVVFRSNKLYGFTRAQVWVGRNRAVDLGGLWERNKYDSENFVRKSERTYKNEEKQTMSFSHS